MPTKKTRRILKMFGIAVTNYEDALKKGVTRRELSKAETEMRRRLREVTALVKSLRARKK